MSLLLHHYEVGPLLYCPANQDWIGDSVLSGILPKPYSLCLCLEDTIHESGVEVALKVMKSTLEKVYETSRTSVFSGFLPKIYIRVRNPKQMGFIFQDLGEVFSLVDGFVAPKISPTNLVEYLESLDKIQSKQEKDCYFMPILEHQEMLDLRTRVDFLYQIRETLEPVADLVASVRVGGTDLSHCYHLRRNQKTSIHSIPVLSQLFGDIMTVFGENYLVSGAVWEYYNGIGWDTGLKGELEQDRNCGFVGKTVIHPKQIPLVHGAYRVSKYDFEDATALLNEGEFDHTLVKGSVARERMNEKKTHCNWAKRILMLAEVYGME